MTAALILAAGIVSEDSKRKPMDAIDGASSIKRIIMVFKQAGIKKIVVVTGYDAEEMENHCGRMGVIFLRNNDYNIGDMLSIVRIGLDYLKDKCDKAFITPADVSLFSSETVKTMEKSSEPIVIPICYNKTGHPLLLAHSLFSRVIEYSGSGGIGGALSGADAERRFLDVSDEGIFIDVREHEDISTAVEGHGLRQIRAEAKVYLLCVKNFYGPGTHLLLNLIRETGSLKHAAQRMAVSHSKAIKMIAIAEEQLGFRLLATGRGGYPGGGRSEVTKEAMELMRRYEAFESECSCLVRGVFERHFGDMAPIHAR